MPPSPSLRRSPGMEPHGDSHRRGRSFECRLSFKERDDDLALFNEMQSRESDNFLLQPTDDFEDLLASKPKPFPDIKLGINIPARGESRDLLNADVGKNDYDWLLTPPETPLFPSLDDEPTPANLVHSGRDRSRPISISRSSTMERNHRSRGSPSPQRFSPSPRSKNGAFNGGPSSAPPSSRVPLRQNSPSRRPSPPPVKPSTPPPRSSSGSRGASPVRTSRGNSTSPKRTAWQSNIPGFSLEAPPNLRTSLGDRPATYVRGSSPASRASSSSKLGRRSMSPAASRNISSSHSQERDRMSSHSRGSLASSGDDDADSLLSVSECNVSRKGVAGFHGSKPLAFSKKPIKTLSGNSAPKRSLDSAMRQMDRKTPQNMFRPLLSSVPSANLYTGTASSAHRRMISRHSSVTTSSNTEGSDQYQDDMASDCATTPYATDIQDQVFDFVGQDDKSGLEAYDVVPDVQLDEPDKTHDFVEIDTLENTVVCSKCDSRYHPNELPESENNICPECKKREEVSSAPLPLMNISQESNLADAIDPESRASESCLEQSVPEVSEQQVTDENKSVDKPSNGSNGSPDLGKCEKKPDSNIDIAERAGISMLLLKRSSSAISYDDLSYTRDLTSSMMSSTGHGSISTLSSVDLPSTGHRDMHNHMKRHLSWRRSDTSSKTRSTLSSLSGSSMQVDRGLGLSTGLHEENYEGILSDMSNIVAGESPESPSNHVVVLESEQSSLSRTGVHEENDNATYVSPKENDASIVVNEDPDLCEDDEEYQKSIDVVENVEESGLHESFVAEESRQDESQVDDQVERREDFPPQCSLFTMSEIEINDSHPSSPRSQIDMVSKEEELDDHSTHMLPDKDVKALSTESSVSDHAAGLAEESTVKVDGQEGGRARSLTLEEATDTILFCNSIIHDLAYKAASIAIEKEKENLEPFEVSRPTVTIPERRDDSRGITTGRTVRTQKARKRREETEPKPPLTENDNRSDEPVVRNVGIPNNADNMKPPKLESKCNCTIM